MADAGKLEIELESGDAGFSSAKFEVHVAEVILAANDVGEQSVAGEITIAVILETRPTEIPATGRLIGTPASMRARTPAQTEAIEVEPLDSMTSLVTRNA